MYHPLHRSHRIVCPQPAVLCVWASSPCLPSLHDFCLSVTFPGFSFYFPPLSVTSCLFYHVSDPFFLFLPSNLLLPYFFLSGFSYLACPIPLPPP